MIESLFSGRRLSDYLGRLLTQAREEIAALPADAVSDSNVDRETPLRNRYSRAPIVLDTSNVQMETPDDPKLRLGMRVPFRDLTNCSSTSRAAQRAFTHVLR